MIDAQKHAVSSIPLIETKLNIPKLRTGSISRPRLVERMHRGIDRKLTIVSAPAGFGKTTLLAEWLASFEDGKPAAGWVSLDERDNDPSVFWAYVISALQTVQPGIGDRALSLIFSPQRSESELILTSLINEISAIEGNIALILDDYHLVQAAPIHEALTFLIDHLPPQLHLVIATRSEPPLPLSRLRAKNDSVELRATDLRFTPDEASAFLNKVMGLTLSGTEIATLETRTEGWIAGLQLAALSMQGRSDTKGFITAFAGDDRYIVDYLAEEVLQQQTAQMRNFLLQTCVLERLSGPLCNAVTQQENGKDMLDALERANLFVVSLDDKRAWYRYHHLFADVLRAHFQEGSPDLAPALHLRASVWYEENGFRSDAIYHAFAGQAFDQAANLIELSARITLRNYQTVHMLDWLKALPEPLVRSRPVLSGYYAFALFGEGDLKKAETYLQVAEDWISASKNEAEQHGAASTGMIVVDEKEFQSLPGTMAIARAYIAGAYGNTRDTLKYAEQGLALLPEDDHLWRGAAGVLLGLAYWASGELAAAQRTHTEGIDNLRKAGDASLPLGATIDLGSILIAQGKLREAIRMYQQTLQRVTGEGVQDVRGVGDIYLELSELHREQGDIKTAAAYWKKSEALSKQLPLLETRYRQCIARARIKEAQGDFDDALSLLEEAERVYMQDPTPRVRPLPALKARVWIAQERLTEAENWARDQGLAANDELSYMREFEHITLARVLLARYNSSKIDRFLHEAKHMLERLLSAAEEGARTGNVIEILLLLAKIYATQSDLPQALTLMERALKLAEPEGYLQIFVKEGPLMRDLLRHAFGSGIMVNYTSRLLSAFDQPDPQDAGHETATRSAHTLTPRELEILRLISAGMRNQQIADHLFISIATVKRHIANTYSKLDVTHRTEAIARAKTLNLL